MTNSKNFTRSSKTKKCNYCDFSHNVIFSLFGVIILLTIITSNFAQKSFDTNIMARLTVTVEPPRPSPFYSEWTPLPKGPPQLRPNDPTEPASAETQYINETKRVPLIFPWDEQSQSNSGEVSSKRQPMQPKYSQPYSDEMSKTHVWYPTKNHNWRSFDIGFGIGKRHNNRNNDSQQESDHKLDTEPIKKRTDNNHNYDKPTANPYLNNGSLFPLPMLVGSHVFVTSDPTASPNNLKAGAISATSESIREARERKIVDTTYDLFNKVKSALELRLFL